MISFQAMEISERISKMFKLERPTRSILITSMSSSSILQSIELRLLRNKLFSLKFEILKYILIVDGRRENIEEALMKIIALKVESEFLIIRESERMLSIRKALRSRELEELIFCNLAMVELRNIGFSAFLFIRGC